MLSWTNPFTTKMQLSRSSVYKMLQIAAPKDRCIDSLPPSFLRQATPYTGEDFDEKVKNAVNGGKLIQTGIKISKLIVLGDVATGKTCLVNRFCHHVFDANYKATIGVDFEVERFDILGIPFNLQIWDTAGQERFKCIAASYYRGAHAIMVVFDVTNLVSLAHTSQWLREALDANPDTNPLIFLVATKRDLLTIHSFNEIEVEARRVALNFGAEYWSVSAKNGVCVRELFMRMAALTFNRAVHRELQRTAKRHSGISLGGSIRIGKLEDSYSSRNSSNCGNQCRN